MAEMRPDEICAKNADRGLKLSVSLLDSATVLIEGDRASLEFLADLIRVQACFEPDSGFSIQPNGAGSVFFRKGSELGIYIHRLENGADA